VHNFLRIPISSDNDYNAFDNMTFSSQILSTNEKGNLTEISYDHGLKIGFKLIPVIDFG
jgi:hypothetical protein